jgi:hypothetical protein
MQVAGEAVARGAVQDVVKRLLPPGALVSQQVEVGRESVAVRLISTRVVPEEKIQAAEREIERRSGRKVILSVASIASQSELAQLMERLSSPSQLAQAPPVQSLEDIRNAVIARITPIVTDVWPVETPLQDFDVALDSTGIVLNVRYQSHRELDKTSQQILERELGEKLGTKDLSLVAKRVPPQRGEPKKKK